MYVFACQKAAIDCRAFAASTSPRTAMASRDIVLASTSVYRRELLQRLRLPFQTMAPDVDESPLPGEGPVVLANRLAYAKAAAVAQHYPDALIIGSDQVAWGDGQRFGKPGDRERAIAQLKAMRGHSIVFHTVVCVLDSRSGSHACVNVPTDVRFRLLSDREIERYVDAEQPFDCAGSAKSEGLGITLLDHIRGDDPTALVGLPLIAVSHLLRDAGLELP